MFVQVDQLDPAKSMEDVALALCEGSTSLAFSLLMTVSISRAIIQKMDNDMIHNMVNMIINATNKALNERDTIH